MQIDYQTETLILALTPISLLREAIARAPKDHPLRSVKLRTIYRYLRSKSAPRVPAAILALKLFAAGDRNHAS